MRWDYGIFGQGRWEMGMEWGRSGRVRHMEFREQIEGFKVRIGNRKVIDMKQGSWKQK